MRTWLIYGTLFSTGLFGSISSAQDANPWAERTLVIETSASSLETPGAGTRVGPLDFSFFCQPSTQSKGMLSLAIQPDSDLGGQWQETYGTGGFDGGVLVRAGDLVVGEASSQTVPQTGQVRLEFDPRNYDFSRLVSGQNLRFEFENSAGEAVFDLNVTGRGLGGALCPIATSCGLNVADVCSLFVAIDGGSTDASPLTDTVDSNGNPRWFKSEYKLATSTLPYESTASIFDPDSGTELHVSCLAEDGESLALSFLRRAQDGTPPLFTPGQDEQAELVWETGDLAGRWTQMNLIENGEGIAREGVSADLMTRATLEELMTTDQSISMAARYGDQEVQASFTPAGSRDAICAVMNSCGISLGFSPACANRR